MVRPTVRVGVPAPASWEGVAGQQVRQTLWKLSADAAGTVTLLRRLVDQCQWIGNASAAAEAEDGLFAALAAVEAILACAEALGSVVKGGDAGAPDGYLLGRLEQLGEVLS